MLVSLILNLNMTGNVTSSEVRANPSVKEEEGGRYSNKNKEKEENERKQVEQEEDELIYALSHWLINFN
jgi:hypothetical protein